MQETMLNEVFTGGLSSYSIVNMVMTHLLCMGYKLPAGTGPGFWGSLVPAPEQPEEDAGNLLTSFLERFGGGFDYSRHAVSVGQVGGPAVYLRPCQTCFCCSLSKCTSTLYTMSLWILDLCKDTAFDTLVVDCTLIKAQVA